MRLLFILWLLSFSLVTAHAQHKQIKIVGQNQLTSPQGKSITLNVADIYVTESGSQDEDGDDDGGHENDGDDESDGTNDDGDNNEDSNEPGDNDHDPGDNEGADKDDKKEKKDKKGNKGNKDDKDHKKGKKGKEGGRNSGTLEYPDGYWIEVFNGPDYDHSGNTVTPYPTFTGILTVKIRVRNEAIVSQTYGLKISITPVTSENTPPVITGQADLRTTANTPLEIAFNDLRVSDPDDEYPVGFSLILVAAENYALNKTTVTPEAGFSGIMTVPLYVNDGQQNSEIFNLKITVVAVNQKPVITGQTGIKIVGGQSLEIKPEHLIVEDSDDPYPENFTLSVLEGEHYNVSNKTITPNPGFLGTLSVKVTVHDGTISSDPFDLEVQVVSADRLEITGQKAIEIQEDSSFTLRRQDLVVYDPAGTYPEGFSLQIIKGENYHVEGDVITPDKDFFGNLTVPIAITRAGTHSASFSLLIVVTPVNDPPQLSNLTTDPINVTGEGPWPLFETGNVEDVDDDHLLFAEAGFATQGYHPGKERLEYGASENIDVVFDHETGVLFMVGRGTLEEYQELIHSLKYTYRSEGDSLALADSRIVYLKLNDGKGTSNLYERALIFETNVPLEIPSAFTPNNDNTNDTWKITPLKDYDQLNAFIRVYDKRGNMVFEATEFTNEWDGHYRGTPLPADIYFYTIEMDLLNQKVNYKGIVSILR